MNNKKTIYKFSTTKVTVVEHENLNNISQFRKKKITHSEF